MKQQKRILIALPWLLLLFSLCWIFYTKCVPSQDIDVSTLYPNSIEQLSINAINTDLPISSNIDSAKEYYGEEFVEYFAENFDDFLEVESLEYGQFTGADQDEILTTFSVEAPHSEGSDRKLVTIVSAKTGELLLQRPFAADSISLHILRPFGKDYVCLLMTGSFLYSGHAHGTVDFGSVENGIWSPQPIPLQESKENITYSYDDATQELLATEWQAGTDETDSYPTPSKSWTFIYDDTTLQFVPK